MGGRPVDRTRFSSTSNQIPGSISLNSAEGNRTRSQILSKRSRMQYPEVQTEEHQAKIRFAVHKAIPLSLDIERVIDNPILDNWKGLGAKFGLTKGSGKTDDDVDISGEGLEETGDGPERVVLAQQRAQITDAEKDATNQAAKLVRGVSYKLSDLPIVDMYLPVSVVFNDTMQYDTPNLGVIGGATLEGMAGGAGLFASAFQGLMEGLGDVFGYLGGDLKGEAARLGALRAARIVPSSGFQAAVSLGLQRTLNPNTRSLFKGVNLREFTFTFKMIANSQREAIMIEKIIEHFRREAYPTAISPEGIPVAYEFPNAFSIQFTHRGQEAKIPRLERCFLRNVQTSYNPTGAAFHADGRPNEVDMTLNFVEMRTLNKDDINKGF